jgi:hypothetical protein
MFTAWPIINLCDCVSGLVVQSQVNVYWNQIGVARSILVSKIVYKSFIFILALEQTTSSVITKIISCI